jgi:hypothetical protein
VNPVPDHQAIATIRPQRIWNLRVGRANMITLSCKPPHVRGSLRRGGRRD